MIVTSFSILQDWTRVLIQDDAHIQSIVGPDEDAHVFEPTPETLRLIQRADLIVVYGLGFETWFRRLIDATSTQKPVVHVAEGIVPLEGMDNVTKRQVKDPHAWHDLDHVIRSMETLAEALKTLLPQHASRIQSRLNAYSHALSQRKHLWHQQIQTLDPSQRVVITSHDGFGYLGASHHIRFLALQGFSTDAQPSAQAMAQLIDQIRKTGVKRVFLENITNDQLITQLAQETGTVVDGPVYSDALSPPDGPAATFLELIDHNWRLFYASMKEIPPSK